MKVSKIALILEEIDIFRNIVFKQRWFSVILGLVLVTSIINVLFDRLYLTQSSSIDVQIIDAHAAV